jgi:hypothetical protein
MPRRYLVQICSFSIHLLIAVDRHARRLDVVIKSTRAAGVALADHGQHSNTPYVVIDRLVIGSDSDIFASNVPGGAKQSRRALLNRNAVLERILNRGPGRSMQYRSLKSVSRERENRELVVSLFSF